MKGTGETMAEYKKRLGDRKEGRWLRKLDPYYSFTPYIMPDRMGSSNAFADKVEISDAEVFLRKKRLEGYKGLGYLHLFVAAYVRMISQYPRINRFVNGRRIYARDNIEYIMTVKKEMLSEAGETSIKVEFEPTDTIFDVYRKMNAAIEAARSEDTSTDDVAGILMKLPRPLLRFVLQIVRGLDFMGWLPGIIRNASPFHGSLVATDMGSLGIPPIFHHLYDFGNVPVFLAFGRKEKAYELNRHGEVEAKKYIYYNIVCDERICDGYYYSQCFKYLTRMLKNPELLEVPPETVKVDTDE